MDLRLVSPSVDYYAAFVDAAEDYRLNGSLEYAQHMGPYNDFCLYVESLCNSDRGVHLKPGYVPESHYWLLEDDSKIVGFSRLRHFLTPILKEAIGHIGYNVPPSHHGKGYGTILLKQTLLKAAEKNITPVLVTVDHDNFPSIRIIQKNKGIQDKRTAIDPESGKTVLRFWID